MSDRSESVSPNVVSPNVVWHTSVLARERRRAATGLVGATVWFTGFSGSGKSTIAAEVERILVESGTPAYLLDGDNLRHGLNGDLGFSSIDRDENVRRVSEVARLFADAGIVSLVPLISPYRAGRDRAREAHELAGLLFIEVFVDTTIEECERRDPKGLYRQARSGLIKGFTGIDDPYEPPQGPELTLSPDDGDPTALAMIVIDRVRSSR